MTLPLGTTRGWLALASVVLGAAFGARGQDVPTQSLGDVARKTRKERATIDHVPAKQLFNEEEDGPDTTGVWRVRQCQRTPCGELSITLPKNPKWTRATAQPRPVFIPLPGPDEDEGRVIRIYAADSLESMYSPVDNAKRTFLQGWFSRPDYFGRAAHIVLDEHVQLNNSPAVISHFIVDTGTEKYRGLSVVASSPNGGYGFACVFRDGDSAAATSICDAIVKSAKSQVLEPAKPVYYPPYQPPPTFYPGTYNPPENSPEEDDPQ
jgi:hypothetical protein